MEWNIGHTLKNRPYRIEKRLGKGGFGITYLAKNLSFNQHDLYVVIKTPNDDLQRDINYPKFLERFNKEANILAKISQQNHPHIVRVVDLFNEGNLPCLVMDYIKGKNLYELVNAQGKLSEERAIKYLKQVGSGLILCHQSGIIHRDITPLNMILREDRDEVVIIDFGIAGNIKTTVDLVGNQAFAPYEQTIEGVKEPTLDVFTLASSGYYLVTKQIATPALNRKLANQSLTPPNQYNNSLSASFNQAILKGLALEAKDRPQTMQKFLDLLLPLPSPSVESLYQKLEQFLAQKEWQKADQKTRQLISKIMGREKVSWLHYKIYRDFPPEKLRKIDQLWLEYSQGKFGFSVQKQIWLKHGGKLDGSYQWDIFLNFAEEVGWTEEKKWLKYSDLTFNTKALPGHLPLVSRVRETSRNGGRGYSFLYSKL